MSFYTDQLLPRFTDVVLGRSVETTRARVRVGAQPAPYPRHGKAIPGGLTPAWGKVFGGCHLNRPTDKLIAAAGLTLETVNTYNMGGPETIGYAYEGTASKPVDPS
jgi:hypothetical protein